MNRYEKPLSMFMGASIIERATPGCVNPPIVTIVEDMAKFASPHTKEKCVANLHTHTCTHAYAHIQIINHLCLFSIHAHCTVVGTVNIRVNLIKYDPEKD